MAVYGAPGTGPAGPVSALPSPYAVPGAVVDPASTIPSFIIDPRKPKMTRKQAEMQRRMAEKLQAQGSDTSPASPWEAAMRPALAAFGVFDEAVAGQAEREGRSSAQQALAQALTGERISPQQLTGFLGNDWAEPGQITALTSIYGDQQKGDDWIEINDMPFNKRTGQFGDPAPGGAGRSIKPAEYRGFTAQYGNLPGVKAYKESVSKFNLVRDLAKQGKATKAESLGLIYNIANILDPGSVVRKEDGELVFTKAQSEANSMKSWVIGLMSGESGLSAPELYNLYQLAEQQVGARYQQAAAERDALIQGTTEFGMSGEDYYLDPFEKYAPPAVNPKKYFPNG